MLRTEIQAAITVMLYTRPAIVAAENIKLTPFRSGNVDGHWAIFSEEEAKERLESGFWVDHPNGLAKLDEAISEAAEKEAKREKQKADDEEAERLKDELEKLKAEQKVEPKVEPTPDPKPAAEPKVEGEKVEGEKVDTKAKVKK